MTIGLLRYVEAVARLRLAAAMRRVAAGKLLFLAKAVVLGGVIAVGALSARSLQAARPGWPLEPISLWAFAVIAFAAAFVTARHKLFYEPSLMNHRLLPIPSRYVAVGQWLEVLGEVFGPRTAAPAYVLVAWRLSSPAGGTGHLSLLVAVLLALALLASVAGALGALFTTGAGPAMAYVASSLAPFVSVALAGLGAWSLSRTGFTLDTPTLALILAATLALVAVCAAVFWLLSGSFYQRACMMIRTGSLREGRRVSRTRWSRLSGVHRWLPAATRAIVVKDLRMLQGNIVTWIRLSILLILSASPLLLPDLLAWLAGLGQPRSALVWGVGLWVICVSELVAAGILSDRAHLALYRALPLDGRSLVLGKSVAGAFLPGVVVAVAVIPLMVRLGFGLGTALAAMVALEAVVVSLSGWILGVTYFLDGGQALDIPRTGQTIADHVLEQAPLSFGSLLALVTAVPLAGAAALFLYGPQGLVHGWVVLALVVAGAGGYGLALRFSARLTRPERLRS